jgi:hypothetical protein
VYVRSTFGPAWGPKGAKNIFPMGYEAQIYPVGKPEDLKTGSLMGGKARVGLREVAAGADQWFDLEVEAIGERITIRVNGRETISHADADRPLRGGRIALQAMGPDTRVEFRSVEVQEVKAGGP